MSFIDGEEIMRDFKEQGLNPDRILFDIPTWIYVVGFVAISYVIYVLIKEYIVALEGLFLMA
jgi:hypothetical protein